MSANPARIEILDDAEQVAVHAAKSFETLAALWKSFGRRCTVALSGGSTPKRLFELLLEKHRDRIDWSNIEFFFGDERSVPPDDANSNYRMAKETLFDHVPIEASQVHRMVAEADDLDTSAAQYEEIIRERVPVGEDGIPRFDLIWLGMGPDGHTASLFPGTDALNENQRLVVDNAVPQLETRRMTMTFPLINAASQVQFLATGVGKAEVLKQVFRQLSEDANADMFPSARIRAARLEWAIDKELWNALF